MRTLCCVGYSIVLSSLTLAAASQAPATGRPATTESLQTQIDQLKAQVSELRRQLVSQGVPSEPSREPVSLIGRPFAGDSGAPLVLVEFVDFQCAFCARHAATTFDQIRARYIDTKLVRYVVKNLPLEEIHPVAFRVAVAAECAQRQQHYWPMHATLFSSGRRLVDLIGLARESGLEGPTFEACLAGSTAAAQVRTEIAEARRLGILGTPSFVIGKSGADATSMQPEVVLSGAQPIEKFAAAIDALLAVAVTPRR